MTDSRAGEAASRLVHAQERPGSTPGPATELPISRRESVEIGPTAGHIITPGVDDVLNALAREEDYVKDRAERFEGRPQTPNELEQWKRLFTQVQKEANKRLNAHGVHLGACAPNPRAWGAAFIGFDTEERRYDVTLAIPSEERRNLELAGREAFVRGLIDMVVGATLAKREEYLRRGGG